MKCCGRCKKEKPVSEFYRHGRNGYQSYCKECSSIKCKINEKNPETRIRRKEYRKKWYEKTGKEWYKEYYSENKEKITSNMRRYRKDPKLRFKMKARAMVGQAIRAGRLFSQSCQTCGAEKTQAHHKDYSKPLLVVWLCGKCHRIESAKLKIG